MSDSGGLNVFALALLITTAGAAEAESALASIDVQGAALGGTFAALAGVVAGVVLAMEALEKASDFLKDSVTAAADEEQVYVRMGVAVENAGQSFGDAKPAIDALLESLSEKSTFRVDELGAAFTRMVQLTGNVGGSMKMLGAVTDFAAGRNIDLTTAANLVGRAMNGNATQLNRMLGLHGSAAQAIAVLTERYHGNAVALADTMGGAMSQASNEMHELMEAVGGVIAQEGGFKTSTQSWRDVLKDATTWVTEHRTQIGELVKDGIALAKFLGGVLLQALRDTRDLWSSSKIAIMQVEMIVKDIGPAFKLMLADLLFVDAKFIDTIVKWVPELHSVLDGARASVRTFAAELTTSANDAFAKNRKELDAFTASLKASKTATEDATKPIPDLDKAHKQTTEELLQEADALAKVGELHAASGPEFAKAAADYQKLTKLVQSHTLSLEMEAKAVEALGKMQKAFPVLGGGFEFDKIDPVKMGKGFEADMNHFNDLIGATLKKSQKQRDKKMADDAKEWQESAAGQWQKASDDLSKSIQNAVTIDFINVGAAIAGTIVDSIGAAFTGGFKAAGKTAEQGLGSIFSQMGKHMLLASGPLKALSAAMHNPITGGWAMAAAGLLLMALGAQLGAIANGGSGGDGGGGYGGSNSIAGAGAASGTAQITNITLSQNSSRSASRLTPVQPIHVGPIIGPNDGRAQRDLTELIRRAVARGLPIGNTGTAS